MKCVICGKEINGPGNSAWPIKEGQCCDECNRKINRACIGKYINDTKSEWLNEQHRVYTEWCSFCKMDTVHHLIRIGGTNDIEIAQCLTCKLVKPA